MKRFYVFHINKNWCIELDLFKSFVSLNWFPIFNHTMDVKLKGSHKGWYWSFYLIGFKIFEINFYNKNHEEYNDQHTPILDF